VSKNLMFSLLHVAVGFVHETVITRIMYYFP